MTPTPDPQAPLAAGLLSDQRLAELCAENAGQQGAAEFLIQANQPIGKSLLAGTQRVEELLGHCAAFRQQVIQALRGLLWPVSDPIVRNGEVWPPTKEEREAKANNDRITAAATRLGLSLGAAAAAGEGG